MTDNDSNDLIDKYVNDATENPYRSPEAIIAPQEIQDSKDSLSPAMLNYLYQASPWLRFIGIIGYIGVGFLILVGIFFAVGMRGITEALGGLENQLWGLFGAFYIPLGVLMFFPAHFTYLFGKKIYKYKFSKISEDLEQAFKNNKSLWKFYGILCIIYLSLIPFLLVVVIIAGVYSMISTI